MKPTQFNLTEAKTHLSELIQKALLGEEVIITRKNRPLVKIVAIKPQNESQVLGKESGWLRISMNHWTTSESNVDCPLSNQAIHYY
jgi:prevent-host-death family protein